MIRSLIYIFFKNSYDQSGLKSHATSLDSPHTDTKTSLLRQQINLGLKMSTVNLKYYASDLQF